MARPRVFVSSTYYDLKHIRASLAGFIESLGFEAVLAERGDIAFAHDVPLDESCYRDAESSDIFVLIIGGRCGSAASTEERKQDRSFFEEYESITRKEYESACRRGIPIYILIERHVDSEYQTYKRNKENEDIDYAHADSANVYRLIGDILSQSQNNVTHTFDTFSDIERWLREQWAGRFRDLLRRMTSQKQIADLSSQVGILGSQVETLGNITTTLKTYLEEVVKRVISPDDAHRLIEVERQRLEAAQMEFERERARQMELEFERMRRAQAERYAEIKNNPAVDRLSQGLSIEEPVLIDAAIGSNTYQEFVNRLSRGQAEKSLVKCYCSDPEIVRGINRVRCAVGRRPFEVDEVLLAGIDPHDGDG